MPRVLSKNRKRKERIKAKGEPSTDTYPHTNTPYSHPDTGPKAKTKTKTKTKEIARFTVDPDRLEEPAVTDATTREPDEPSLVKTVFIHDEMHNTTFPYTVIGPEGQKLSDQLNRKGNPLRPPNSFILMMSANNESLRDTLRNYQEVMGEKVAKFRAADLCELKGNIWRVLKQKEESTLSIFERHARALEKEHKEKYPDYKYKPQRKSKSVHKDYQEEHDGKTEDKENRQRLDTGHRVRRERPSLQAPGSTWQSDEQVMQTMQWQQQPFIVGTWPSPQPDLLATTFVWRCDIGQGESRHSTVGGDAEPLKECTDDVSAATAREARNQKIPVPSNNFRSPQFATPLSLDCGFGSSRELPPNTNNSGSASPPALPDYYNFSGLSLNDSLLGGSDPFALDIEDYLSHSSETAGTPSAQSAASSDDYWSTVIDPFLED